MTNLKGKNDDGIPAAPQPEQRRPTRERKAPAKLNPSTGQNYLQVDEEEAQGYEWDIARYATNLLQAFKERTHVD